MTVPAPPSGDRDTAADTSADDRSVGSARASGTRIENLTANHPTDPAAQPIGDISRRGEHPADN